MPYQRTEVTRPKGINKDLSMYELPIEIWSDGRNVSFHRNRTSSLPGYDNVFVLEDTIVNPLYHIWYTDSDGDDFWMYASGVEIWKTNGVTANSKGVGYTASREINWTGCNFNQVVILNNQNDHPQALDPSTDLMIDLPNWAGVSPWGTNSRCKVIRPYKNYLMAMDCWEEGGQRYGNMIRWSSPAEAGDVPPSWDPADPGEQAGLYRLADTPGNIVDGLTLGDYFIVYKTDAVWTIQFIGGDFVMRFTKLFGDEAGCLSTDCVAEFEGQHFVLSSTGAYIHNGATKQEIMEPWVKDEFFNKVAKDRINETKVVVDSNRQEIGVYFVTADAYAVDNNAWADRALIWDWTIGEWTIRDLSGVSHIAEGIIEGTGIGDDDWDTDDQAWDEDSSAWGQIDFNATNRGLLLADHDNRVFYANGYGRTLAGEPSLKWVQRQGVDLGDDRLFKYVTRIVPHVISQNPITIKVYAEDTQTGVPTLIHSSEFDSNIDHDIDCHVIGRNIGVQFESYNDFILTGYTIEWEPAGSF
jgi:hypothetical protein